MSISDQADLAWTGWRTEARDAHGRWTRGGPHLDTGTGPFSPGVRHLYSLLPEVDKAIAAGRGEEMSSTQAVTRMVTLPSGEKVIDKQGEMPEDLDREELASYLAHAIGAPAPAVYRAAPDRILQEVVPGKTAARYFSDIMDTAYKNAQADGADPIEAIRAEEEAEDDARDAVYDSPEARKIADLDYLISNEDRNETNWMVAGDGHPVAIDHGVAGFDGFPSDSTFVIQSDPMQRGHPGAETPDDPAAVKFRQDRAAYGMDLADKLHAVVPQFARLGHEDWMDNILETPVAQLISPEDPRMAHWQILKHWQDKYGDPEPWMAKPTRGVLDPHLHR